MLAADRGGLQPCLEDQRHTRTSTTVPPSVAKATSVSGPDVPASR